MGRRSQRSTACCALGASTEMVSRFGPDAPGGRPRRDILSLPKRKGRHPVLDEGAGRLWKRWKVGVTGRGIPALDDKDGDAGADHGPGRTSRTCRCPVIWSAIRNWIDRGWCRPWRPAKRTRRDGPVALSALFDDALRELVPPAPAQRALLPTAPAPPVSDFFLYSGNRHESVPRVFLDRR